MSMADFLFICIWVVVCKGHRKINDRKLNIQVRAQVKKSINFSFASAKLQMKRNTFVMIPNQLDLLRLLIEAAASEFQGNVQRKGTIFYFKRGQCLFFLHG